MSNTKASGTANERATDKFLQQYVRPGLNFHQLEEIKNVFDAFDLQQTGFINPREIKKAIQQEGGDATSNPLYQVICDLDQEGGGCIDFEKFVFFLTPTISGSESKEELREVFQLFNDEKTGLLTERGLRRAVMQCHLEWDEKEVQEMLRQADADGDGCINFQDFYSILSYKSGF